MTQIQHFYLFFKSDCENSPLQAPKGHLNELASLGVLYLSIYILLLLLILLQHKVLQHPLVSLSRCSMDSYGALVLYRSQIDNAQIIGNQSCLYSILGQDPCSTRVYDGWIFPWCISRGYMVGKKEQIGLPMQVPWVCVCRHITDFVHFM